MSQPHVQVGDPTDARLAFFGTPALAAVHLEGLLAAGYRPRVVVTQPDRPAGRGKHVRAPRTKQVAEAAGLEVWQPARVRQRAFIDTYAALELDVAIVVAYGQILAPRMLDASRLGSFNVHASLLPRWRGPAPIEWALLAGDEHTGVSLQRMVRGLDEGPVVATQTVPIDVADDRERLHDKLAVAGTAMLVEALPGVLSNTIVARPQSSDGVTYAPIPGPAQARLDPQTQTAQEFTRRVRALHGNPGTWAMVELKAGGVRPLKVLHAEIVPEPAANELVAGQDGAVSPGSRLLTPAAAHDFVIATTAGLVRIVRCQPPSKPPMDAAAFLAGHPVVAMGPME